MKPYFTQQKNLSEQLTVNFDSTLKINLGYITSDLRQDDSFSFEIIINDHIQDAQSLCNQENNCFISFVEDPEYENAMFLNINAPESAFRQYYYCVTKTSGNKGEVLNLRLTLRLTSKQTGDQNDYNIFVKLVKDESTVDQNEGWSQETPMQPSKAE